MSFKSAIRDLVASYNGIEEGRRHPAQFTDKERTVLVTCNQDPAPDHLNSLVVCVRVAVIDSRFTIEAVIEQWNTLAQTITSSKNLERDLFVMECDPQKNTSWLTLGDKIMTEEEAAESVLVRALLQQPAAVSIGISAVA
jgi:hypothetical protein